MIIIGVRLPVHQLADDGATLDHLVTFRILSADLGATDDCLNFEESVTDALGVDGARGHRSTLLDIGTRLHLHRDRDKRLQTTISFGSLEETIDLELLHLVGEDADLMIEFLAEHFVPLDRATCGHFADLVWDCVGSCTQLIND